MTSIEFNMFPNSVLYKDKEAEWWAVYGPDYGPAGIAVSKNHAVRKFLSDAGVVCDATFPNDETVEQLWAECQKKDFRVVQISIQELHK